MVEECMRRSCNRAVMNLSDGCCVAALACSVMCLCRCKTPHNGEFLRLECCLPVQLCILQLRAPVQLLLQHQPLGCQASQTQLHVFVRSSTWHALGSPAPLSLDSRVQAGVHSHCICHPSHHPVVHPTLLYTQQHFSRTTLLTQPPHSTPSQHTHRLGEGPASRLRGLRGCQLVRSSLSSQAQESKARGRSTSSSSRSRRRPQPDGLMSRSTHNA